jgi:hypothetical protein
VTCIAHRIVGNNGQARVWGSPVTASISYIASLGGAADISFLIGPCFGIFILPENMIFVVVLYLQSTIGRRSTASPCPLDEANKPDTH